MPTFVIDINSDSPNDQATGYASPQGIHYGSLREAINYANSFPDETTNISVLPNVLNMHDFNGQNGTILLSQDLPLVTSSINFDAAGLTIDGDSQYRGLILAGVGSDGINSKSTSVSISNLTFQNVLAAGGNGVDGGGGGLGAGGAIFVGPMANVTLTNVDISGATAKGGLGSTDPNNQGGGGGGGLVGNGGGSTAAFAGGGGGGIMYGGGSTAQNNTGAGGGGITGAGGDVTAQNYGGAGGAGVPSTGGGFLGGGGGGSTYYQGATQGKGGGTGAGSGTNGNPATTIGGGGAGGFGGGGGGGSAGRVQAGGNGGFGGGGGGGPYQRGGNGGFGGGGGSGGGMFGNTGHGGFGGGGSSSLGGADGSLNGGFGAAYGADAAQSGPGTGSGAAMGGAIFVASGGSLTIGGTSNESGGKVSVIAAGHLADGTRTSGAYGFDSGIFFEGAPTGSAPAVLGFGAGNQSFADAIGDLNAASISLGDLAAGTMENNGLGGNGGVTAILKNGAGTLTLAGTNTYTGGTTFAAGTIAVGADANLGAAAGGLNFSGGTLEVTAGFSSARTVGLTSGTMGSVQVDASGTSGQLTLSGVVSGSGALEKIGGGTLSLASKSSTYSGGTTIDAGTLDLDAADTSTHGAVSMGAAGTGAIIFDAAAPNAVGAAPTATLQLENVAQPGSGTTYGHTLDDFGSGDALDLRGLTAGIATFTPTAGTDAGTLTVTGVEGTTPTVENFTLADPGSMLFSTQSDSDGGGTLIQAVTCFVSGTLIRTVRGDVAVESLNVGDLVVKSSGAHRPIRWLGHRTIDCRRHPRPDEVMPVRIAAHALGDNRPARDLFVSPGHAICLDLLGEVLVPAIALVNGATVTQDDVDTVNYWHVELDSHDLLLAENLPTESYMDVGNRSFFAEGGVVALDATPDAPAPSTADYCRPFHTCESALVAVVRDQLRARAATTLGWRLAAPAAPDDLWLEVDGVRVDPARSGLFARAILPATAREVFLCSTSAVPALTIGEADGRRLGVKLAGLVVDDGLNCRREIGCGDPRLATGFHAGEGTHRWSAGRARLPAELWAGVAADFYLRIALAGPVLPRWFVSAHEFKLERKAATA